MIWAPPVPPVVLPNRAPIRYLFAGGLLTETDIVFTLLHDVLYKAAVKYA